jgi:hypothetical protein
MLAIATDHVSADAIIAIIGLPYSARLNAQIGTLKYSGVFGLVVDAQRRDDPEGYR